MDLSLCFSSDPRYLRSRSCSELRVSVSVLRDDAFSQAPNPTALTGGLENRCAQGPYARKVELKVYSRKKLHEAE